MFGSDGDVATCKEVGNEDESAALGADEPAIAAGGAAAPSETLSSRARRAIS
jgi:hypothetical protein